MYSLHCTRKLLDCLRGTANASPPAPTTALGNWYATALFWKPRVALLVNERTLLPVLMPLAPSSTLTERIAAEVSRVLGMHGAGEEFVANEPGQIAQQLGEDVAYWIALAALEAVAPSTARDKLERTIRKERGRAKAQGDLDF